MHIFEFQHVKAALILGRYSLFCNSIKLLNHSIIQYIHIQEVHEQQCSPEQHCLLEIFSLHKYSHRHTSTSNIYNSEKMTINERPMDLNGHLSIRDSTHIFC